MHHAHTASQLRTDVSACVHMESMWQTACIIQDAKYLNAGCVGAKGPYIAIRCPKHSDGGSAESSDMISVLASYTNTTWGEVSPESRTGGRNGPIRGYSETGDASLAYWAGVSAELKAPHGEVKYGDSTNCKRLPRRQSEVRSVLVCKKLKRRPQANGTAACTRWYVLCGNRCAEANETKTYTKYNHCVFNARKGPALPRMSPSSEIILVGPRHMHSTLTVAPVH